MLLDAIFSNIFESKDEQFVLKKLKQKKKIGFIQKNSLNIYFLPL